MSKYDNVDVTPEDIKFLNQGMSRVLRQLSRKNIRIMSMHELAGVEQAEWEAMTNKERIEAVAIHREVAYGKEAANARLDKTKLEIGDG